MPRGGQNSPDAFFNSALIPWRKKREKPGSGDVRGLRREQQGCCTWKNSFFLSNPSPRNLAGTSLPTSITMEPSTRSPRSPQCLVHCSHGSAWLQLCRDHCRQSGSVPGTALLKISICLRTRPKGPSKDQGYPWVGTCSKTESTRPEGCRVGRRTRRKGARGLCVH